MIFHIPHLKLIFHFDNLYIAKHGHDKDKKDEDVYVPVAITVGVTLSLCGLFLLLVPIPICKTSGWYLLDAGIGALGWTAVDKWDEYDRKKHEEKEKE